MQSTDYRDQVHSALEAATVRSPTRCAWFGKLSPELVPRLRRSLDPGTIRKYLLSQLVGILYRCFYCHGGAVPAQTARDDAFVDGEAFAAGLSVANHSEGFYESGWIVREIDGGVLVVGNGQLDVLTTHEDWVAANGAPPMVGAGGALRMPKELSRRSPGHYLAIGTLGDTAAAGGRVRVYWHVTAEYAHRFVSCATLALNAARIPFRLKILNQPAQYIRADAAVLYLLRADWDRAQAALTRLYQEVWLGLRPSVPALTKYIAPGLALAEDLDDGGSYGMSRCTIIADAAIRAWETGAYEKHEQLAITERCFEELGLSLDCPYLNPHSVDTYSIPKTLPVRCFQRRSADRATSSHYLRAAENIGRRLVRDAIWSGGLCNWVGAGVGGPTPRPSWLALGADLYGGTSGIGTFLGELAHRTADRELRRTALAACRHALSRVESIPVDERLALYTGWCGVALGALRVGMLLDDEEIAAKALALGTRVKELDPNRVGFDWIAGLAGAIVALLALGECGRDQTFTTLAACLGDRLVECADRTGPGVSWQSRTGRQERNLLGLGHGAAGIGCAFTELYASTEDPRYSAIAQEAFAYERHWFDTAAGNWPDFRGVTSRRRLTPGDLSFATAWCHGAAGIALTRVRALEVMYSVACRDDAVTALATTEAFVRASLRSAEPDYCLCHGLAGNAEILWEGARRLSHPAALQFAAAATAVADEGIERYDARGDWPCGFSGNAAPGVFTGLAGIGYFYLRLLDPSIPSLLLPPWRTRAASLNSIAATTPECSGAS